MPALETAIDQFTGEELLVKFELLKANCIGKLEGLANFKKALNYVALTYPNSFEGKETEQFLSTKIPYLESLSFTKEKSLSWKLIFLVSFPEEKSTEVLKEKLTKFVKERTIETLNFSDDVFLIDKNFLVIHGIKTEESAKGIASVLKEYKEYKIDQVSNVISSDNYKVLQIKKNFAEFISDKWVVNVLKTPVANIKTAAEKTVVPAENKMPEDLQRKSASENVMPPAIQKMMDEQAKKTDRKSTRLNSSHRNTSRMPSYA